MKNEETDPPRTLRPNFKAIKFFLLGVALEVTPVCVYLLWFVTRTPRGFCDGCTPGQRLSEGVRIAAEVVLILSIYFWYVAVPVLLGPPVVGLVMDYRRYGRRGEG